MMKKGESMLPRAQSEGLLLAAVFACGVFVSLPALSQPDSNTVNNPVNSNIAPAALAQTKIYKYQGERTVTFSDMPPIKGPYIIWQPSCFACKVTSAIKWQSIRLHLQEFTDFIDTAARTHAVDPALVRAVIHAESNFNPNARSHKGASGLMQLMPGTASSLGVRDVFMPGSNIDGGVLYLARLLARFQGNIDLVLAAYNAGPEAVAKYSGVPPYAETRVYVERVKILHGRYKEQR
jgi:soluble lytic murein transglycosylase-like protein